MGDPPAEKERGEPLLARRAKLTSTVIEYRPSPEIAQLLAPSYHAFDILRPFIARGQFVGPFNGSLSRKKQPPPEPREGTTAMSRRISWVEEAEATDTRDIDIETVVKAIRTGGNKLRGQVEQIRNRFDAELALTGNDFDAAKRAVDSLKKKLPGIMPNGRFSSRKQPVPPKLTEHSGLVVIDGDRLTHTQVNNACEKLTASPHAAMVFRSPTGHGFKAFIRVRPDPSQHRGSFRAATAHVEELTGLQMDGSGKNLGRLCFMSYDPDVYYNPNAQELAPLPEPIKTKRDPSGDVNLSERQRIAVTMLGAIEWDNASHGFLTCPGKHLHSTTDQETDCEIYLDGAPTIHCFHSSCGGIIDGINHELRSQVWKAEHPKTTTANPVDEDSGGAPDARPLPVVKDVAHLVLNNPQPPPEIIKGLLHQGAKMIVAGGSKTLKTWNLIDLSIAVATGSTWLGFPAEQGRVLYINLELPESFFAIRSKLILEARGLELKEGVFDVWNLRGYANSFPLLFGSILDRAGTDKYKLIVVDPIYKVLGERAENVTHEVTSLMNELESLAVQSNAAVAFGAHFPKGNQAMKEAIDRIGGSGAFARDPDSILIVTPHEEADCFTVEPILRNLSPIAPFVIRWNFPVMARDEELDPERLKQIKRGRPPVYSDTEVLGLLRDKALRATDWQKIAEDEMGIKTTAFYEILRRLRKGERVLKVAGLWTPT